MPKKENKYRVPVKTIDQTCDIHTGLHVCVERKHMTKGSRTMTHAAGPVSTLTIRVLDMDTTGSYRENAIANESEDGDSLT